MGQFKKLRRMAEEYAGLFASEGFTNLFAMLQRELGDEYFAEIQRHLKELQFHRGILISAGLGEGNKGTGYVLRKLPPKQGSWIEQVTDQFLTKKPPSFKFCIAPRDESGARALSELKNRGQNFAANALAQSNDHILSFFNMLRAELGFYVGCLNLYEQLARKGEPVCYPVPVAASERKHSFTGLYDVCLSLRLEQRVIGNDVNADNKVLAIVTGANQGGKSTFLRSIGLSQLMMQSGMFVPASSFVANVCDGLFTHYKREEDTAMESGKFDEELSRMSEMADHIKPNSLVLFNESFAATNDREGSEIARQIVRALLEAGVKVFFVTHLYDFAHSFYAGTAGADADAGIVEAIFLRAQREADSSRPGGHPAHTRTFKLVEGGPLQTSFGEDVYLKIFGSDGSALPEPSEASEPHQNGFHASQSDELQRIAL